MTLDTGEPGWALDLEQAGIEAAHARAPLEVAVLTASVNLDDELDGLARLVLRLGPPLIRWMVFDRHTLTTPAALATLARRHLRPVAPHAPIGGGSYQHFAELNRNRPPLDALDYLCLRAHATGARRRRGDDDGERRPGGRRASNASQVRAGSIDRRSRR